jgi:enoyl-CoA hydratase/carnithine racemase
MPYDAPELGIEIRDHVATVEIRRPPHNFFDFELIRQIADTYEALDDDPACRAIVLCSDGKSFCAGANFGSGDTVQADGSVEGSLNRVGVDHLYIEAVRVFRCAKPVIAAVQGAAIGGGLGLALSADFRVGCAESRFAANFTRLGFHPGFGLTETLPRVIGQQKASLMFLTSRRIKGEEALAWGLLDDFTSLDKVRAHAWGLAREIAVNAPLGVVSTRATMRQGLADAVRAATDHELEEQTRLRTTEDFREGVAATADRRIPEFKGR